MEQDDVKHSPSSQARGESHSAEKGGANATVLNDSVAESAGGNRDTKESSCCSKSDSVAESAGGNRDTKESSCCSQGDSVAESAGGNRDTKESSCCSKGGGICASVPGNSEMLVVNGQEGEGRAKDRQAEMLVVNGQEGEGRAKDRQTFRNNDGISHQQDGNNSSTVTQADRAHLTAADDNQPTTAKGDRVIPTTSDDEVSKTNVGRAHPTTQGCANCATLLAKLHQEEERCTVLRDNIHKVSANWFQRKSQLSESETEGDVSPVPLLSSTKKMAEDEEDEGETSCGGVSEKAINRSRDMTKLVSIIGQKSAQLDLSDSQCRELKKRMREYEKIIDDKEDIIHGLKEQLETYLTDNQNMSVQLNNLASLFHQLEKVDKESVSVPQPQEAEAEVSATVPLPTQDDFQEMASSVSRTYIKLKDLIYEKKALVTEIERLNTLNVELQRRVLQQETRLMSVSDALHQTWLVVSDLKDQHAKLHDDELIMKYELKEKREILTKLRRELESARAQWQVIRQKNFESELEYASIREMLQERRKASQSEQVPNEDKKDCEEEPDEAVCLHPDDTKSFDPPVDLLLEMGLEYGIIGEDAEMTQTVLGLIRGEDIRNNRLEQLEEHCSLLYQKLLSSTSRSLSLASRLSRLHTQFSSSEEELDGEGAYLVEGEEEEEEGEEELDYLEGGEQIEDSDQDEDGDEQEAQYYSDANHMAILESVLSSPDSEEYDTAYVSETEGQDVGQAARTTVDNIQELTEPEPQAGPSEVQSILDSDLTGEAEEACLSAELEENCDRLSRRLINFLPRKIEFLKGENKKLELNVLGLKEERERAENASLRLEKDKERLEEELKGLTKDMTMEKLQRMQLEQQLKHLGKCVDELKLKHQAEKNAPAATFSKQEQQQRSKEEELQTEEEGGEEEDDRGEAETGKGEAREERSREDVQMKREVELVKKDMELKKKEKELRRKEVEMAKREQEFEERVRGSSRRESIAQPVEGASSTSQQQPLSSPHGRPFVAPLPLPATASRDDPPLSAPPTTPLPSHAAAGGANINCVGELVALLLQRVSAADPIKENGPNCATENCCIAREAQPNNTSLIIPGNKQGISRDTEPPRVLSPSTTVCSASTTACSTSSTVCSASTTACSAPVSLDITQYSLPTDPLLPRIILEPHITSQALETRGPLVVETSVAADEFLIIPLQLTVPGQQVILRIHATPDASLLVLQSETDPTAPTARSASALPPQPPHLLVPPFPVPHCGSCLRITSRCHTINCLTVITTTEGTATARVTYSAALGSWQGEEGDPPTEGQ